MTINLENLKQNDYKWELQLTAKVKLAAEALNNEGTVGNMSQSRVFELVNGDTRNAITGSALSHAYNSHLRSVVDKRELCDACKILSPMRDGIVRESSEDLSPSGNRTKNCPLCDLAGFMHVSEGNMKREKAAQFAWGIATEESTLNSVLRNRVDVTQNAGITIEKKSKKKKKDTDTDENKEEKEKNNMMIFHEDVRSSEYAITVRLDLSRISFDDEMQKYVSDDKEFIKKRVKEAIIALKNFVLDMSGAKVSVNMPHLLGIEGVLTECSDGSQVISKYSALNTDYIDVHKAMDKNNTFEFKDVAEFIEAINEFTEENYLETMVVRNMNFANELF